MPNIEYWSKETADLVSKALAKDASTQGYNTSTGLVGIELAEYARVLIPALTPFRNTVPRKQAPVGAKAALWRAITTANAMNIRPTLSFGGAGVIPTTVEKDFSAAYQLIAQGGRVMDDAVALARGFDDPKALSVQNTLIDVMKQEEILLLGAQNFSLGTVSAPTLAPASSGGSIGAVNVGVAVAARTMQGVQDGQSTAASSPATTGALTGTTNSVVATVSAVPGAYVYDWYVGTAGGTLYYYGTTTVNSITITSVPTSAAAASGVPGCAVPGYPTVGSDGTVTMNLVTTAAQCTTDNSADPNAFNGFTASITGDFVQANGFNVFGTRGTGASCGAYYKSLNGANLTGNAGTVSEIDAALDYLWQTYKVAPSKIYCNSRIHTAMSNKMVSTGNSLTMIPIQSPDQRIAGVGGVLEQQYMNKSAKGFLSIESLPWIPSGTILIASETLPFPNSRVTNVFEVETQRDYYTYPYATARSFGANGGPRYDYDVRAIETFKNYFPGAHAIIQNVGEN